MKWKINKSFPVTVQCAGWGATRQELFEVRQEVQILAKQFDEKAWTAVADANF